MLHCRTLLILVPLGVILTACAPKPAAQRGIFDLSNTPLNNAPSATSTSIPDHSGHQNGSGSFSTGIGGGGMGQIPGAPAGGF